MMKRNQKIAVAASLLIALYALTGFLVIPYIIQKQLPEKLEELVNRPVMVNTVRLNPFTLTLSVEGFRILRKNSSEPFVAFQTLRVNAQLSSLFYLGPIVKEITLDTPVLSIVRISEQRFNFSDLLEQPEPENTDPAEQGAGTPLEFSISNIRIMNGTIELEDQVLRKKHTISELSFSLPFISNFEKHIETQTKPGLSVKINQTRLTADVETKPFTDTLETRIELNLTGIDLPRYVAYIPVDLGVRVPDGNLDIQSSIFFSQRKDQPFLLEVSGRINLQNLKMLDRTEQPLLNLPGLELELAPSRVLEKEILIRKLAVTKPEIDIIRNRSGEINLLSLGPPPETSAPPEEPADPAVSDTDADPILLQLNQVSLSSARLRFTDQYVNEAFRQTGSDPVAIEAGPLDLTVTNFSTRPDQKADFRIAARINRNGDVKADGRLGIAPLFVETRFDVNELVFTWIEPYLQENVRLAFADGRLSSSGKVTVQTGPDKSIQSKIACSASIENLKTVDKTHAEDFFQLDGLFLEGIDVSVNPTRIHLEEIRVNGLRNRMIVHPDGQLNLNAILVKKAGEAPAESKEPADAPPIPIAVRQVSLKDIQLAYLDKQVEPSFSTTLKLVEGRIAGLTSENFQMADVSIQGNIDEHAPLRVTGKINPLQDNLFADMKIKLTGIELSPFTPYAGRFIGKAIEKGKLSMDLETKIDRNTLALDNKILFDQLTMGRNIDSPDALSVPIHLVVAVLQDRNGQIHLDIPVSGRLDDPAFSLWNATLDALVNIIKKTATSPFDVIAGIAGGGEELQYIEFHPGMAGITETSQKKLDAVGEVLYKRPGLKLGISGYADIKQDRNQLQTNRLNRKIKAQKRLALIADGKKPGPLEQIQVSAEEYPVYLKQALRAETGESPEDDMTHQAMEERILTNITITDSELRQLAQDRARSVKTYILEKNQVEADRLFLTETAALAPEAHDHVGSSRVELSLQ